MERTPAWTKEDEDEYQLSEGMDGIAFREEAEKTTHDVRNGTSSSDKSDHTERSVAKQSVH